MNPDDFSQYALAVTGALGILVGFATPIIQRRGDWRTGRRAEQKAIAVRILELWEKDGALEDLRDPNTLRLALLLSGRLRAGNARALVSDFVTAARNPQIDNDALLSQWETTFLRLAAIARA